MSRVKKMETSKMRRWTRGVLIGVSVLAAVVAVGLPATVGIRPFIGAKVRPLTNRRFEATPARLERGRYLVTSAQTPCVLCHSPLDPTGGELKVKDGMMLAGRN